MGNELSEEKINELVDHPDQLEAFLERVEEIENRHQGMIKIEKSIKELHHLWMELNVLVTEQQEALDRIEQNVDETKHYVEKAKANIIKSEKTNKCTRKLSCCALCLCLVIVIILAIVFG